MSSEPRSSSLRPGAYRRAKAELLPVMRDLGRERRTHLHEHKCSGACSVAFGLSARIMAIGFELHGASSDDYAVAVQRNVTAMEALNVAPPALSASEAKADQNPNPSSVASNHE